MYCRYIDLPLSDRIVQIFQDTYVTGALRHRCPDQLESQIHQNTMRREKLKVMLRRVYTLVSQAGMESPAFIDELDDSLIEYDKHRNKMKYNIMDIWIY